MRFADAGAVGQHAEAVHTPVGAPPTEGDAASFEPGDQRRARHAEQPGAAAADDARTCEYPHQRSPAIIEGLGGAGMVAAVAWAARVKRLSA